MWLHLLDWIKLKTGVTVTGVIGLGSECVELSESLSTAMYLFVVYSISIYRVEGIKPQMPALVAVYFGFTFLLTLTLGYLQTPFRLPGAMDAPHSGNIESILAVLAVCVQAFVSIVLLGGTVWFPPAAGFFSLTLLCHHAIIHRHSRFEGETCSCAPFQCKDVSNHETWVVAGLVAAGISLLHL